MGEQKTDEGYESSPSPVSNHSLEANGDTFLGADFDNLDQFSFNLDFDKTIDGHNDFIIYNDVSIPMEDQNDPVWCPPSPEFTLQKIGVIDDPVLHDAFMKANGVEGKEMGASGGMKHRRGQIRMEPTEIKDKTHERNVVRCRDYRQTKKEKDMKQISELAQLEEENNRLKKEEEEMRKRLEKYKRIYLDLITSGRIIFV